MQKAHRDIFVCYIIKPVVLLVHPF